MKDDKIITAGAKKFALMKKKVFLVNLEKREKRLVETRYSIDKFANDSEE